MLLTTHCIPLKQTTVKSSMLCQISFCATSALGWICTWMQSVLSLLSNMSISVFWGHERLSDRSISKRYLKSDANPWVEKISKSVSRSWFMILMVIWKRSAWGFYRWAVALSLNGNATAHRTALKNASVLVWIQLKPPPIPQNPSHCSPVSWQVSAIANQQYLYVIIHNKT